MPPQKRAFTLVEIIVVVTLTALFVTVLYDYWFTATRYSLQVENRMASLTVGQVALARISQEVAQARRVIYPAPGRRAQAGVVLIDGRGRPVMLALEQSAARAGPVSGRIRRSELATGTSEVLAQGVQDFQCRVPAVPYARDPDLVEMTLVLDGPGGKHLYLATSARLRPLDVRCPLLRDR